MGNARLQLPHITIKLYYDVENSKSLKTNCRITTLIRRPFKRFHLTLLHMEDSQIRILTLAIINNTYYLAPFAIAVKVMGVNELACTQQLICRIHGIQL